MNEFQLGVFHEILLNLAMFGAVAWAAFALGREYERIDNSQDDDNPPLALA